MRPKKQTHLQDYMLIATSHTRLLLIDRPSKARGGEPPRSPTPFKSLGTSLDDVMVCAAPRDNGQVGEDKSTQAKVISTEQVLEV